MYTERKNNIKNLFFSALIVFAIVCIIRFFDMEMSFHSMPFDIMQNYHFALFITFLFFLLFFILTFFLYKLSETNGTSKQTMYLIVFVATFIFPMFLHKDFFGSSDVYAWILCFANILLFLTNTCLYLIPIGMFVMTYLCPMSVFSMALFIFILLLNKYFYTSNKKYCLYGIFGFFLSIFSLILNKINGMFTTDVQSSFILIRFIIAIVLIIPYILLGIAFFKNAFELEQTKKRIAIVYSFLAGYLAPIIYTILGDYSKAFFYGFVYYLLFILIQVTTGNKTFTSALQKTYAIVNNYLSFPEIFIVYPFVIMTFWISGPIELYVEVFVG